MMYLKLCSVIYRFYAKREGMPSSPTFLLTTLLVFFNVIAVRNILNFYWELDILTGKVEYYSVAVLVGAVNYLLVFKNQRYKGVKVSPISGLFVVAYIVLTFSVLIFIGSKIRKVNQSKKSQGEFSQAVDGGILDDYYDLVCKKIISSEIS